MNTGKPTRREALKLLLVLPFSSLLAACTRALGLESTTAPTATSSSLLQLAPQSSPTSAILLAPTPQCGDDDDDPTPAQTEGPYYTPDTPQRTSLLEVGIQGTLLTVVGQVLSTDCQPIAATLIDFWHCDSNGVYDNAGYTLRGHQFTDENGRYALETILPGLYPGRTRHIHVKVQAPNQPVLTTQLYFPDEPANATDGIYDPRLVMDMTETTSGLQGVFDFVLQT